MTSDQNKKPDEPLEGLRGYLTSSFHQAKTQVGESLETLSNNARKNLKAGEKATGLALDFIQETVGKDRIVGAVVGAKAGGTIGLAGGVPGMIKGGIIGAAVGFVGGRKFVDWYNKGEEKNAAPSNDTDKKPEDKEESGPSPPRL